MRNAERELITLGIGRVLTNHVQIDEKGGIIQRSTTQDNNMYIPKVEKGMLRIEVGEKTLVWQEIWVDDKRAGFTLVERGSLHHIPQRVRADRALRIEVIDVANEPPPEH